MADYQALARRYRPQHFREVVGQEAVVRTLINALRQKRLAHAYLFSGARGTGKTTLARLLAKALNCANLSPEGEPCNACAACLEVGQGSSLDVLEIDGASHRGIDDIRQLNETVGYAASPGRTKVYIVDEVHMLTKEAFNALLKTLEEPPPRVKFFFATTEPHRVPATIISRCQHFALSRLPSQLIAGKLRQEATDLGVKIDETALNLISQAADGGMRDAESILDQVISFHGTQIDEQAVNDVLGLAPRSTYFRLDEAAQAGQLEVAFDVAAEIFASGRDLNQFVEELMEHYRTLLLITLGEGASHLVSLSQDLLAQYRLSAERFDRTQLLCLLDDLVIAHETLRRAPSKQVALEMILTRVIRTPQRIPIEALVQRLSQLEGKESTRPLPPAKSPAKPLPPPPKPSKEITSSPSPKREAGKAQSRYDTLLRFAAVEMDGRVENIRNR